MNALAIILNIVLILISIVLIAVVLMQQGQRQGLGAIAGGAETFLGKNASKGLDGKLAKITKIAAIVFIVLAIATTMVVSHNSEYAQSANSISVHGDHIDMPDGTTIDMADVTVEQLVEAGLTEEEAAALIAELEAYAAETETEVEGEVHDDHVHAEDGTITDLEGNVISEEEAHGTEEAAETETVAEATEVPAVEATEAPTEEAAAEEATAE